MADAPGIASYPLPPLPKSPLKTAYGRPCGEAIESSHTRNPLTQYSWVIPRVTELGKEKKKKKKGEKVSGKYLEGGWVWLRAQVVAGPSE